MCNLATYDYINEYIYIRLSPSNDIVNLKNIVIESVFEYPHIIEIETLAGKKLVMSLLLMMMNSYCRKTL